MFSQRKKMEDDVLIFNTFTLHANAYFICFELDDENVPNLQIICSNNNNSRICNMGASITNMRGSITHSFSLQNISFIPFHFQNTIVIHISNDR